MEDAPQVQAVTPSPLMPSAEHHARRAWLLVALAVMFWMVVCAIHSCLMFKKGCDDLNALLGQAVTAFGHEINERGELMSKQAELLLSSPPWLENGNILLSEGSDKVVDEAVRKLLLRSLNEVDASILLVLNDKRQVVRSVEKPYPSTFIDSVAAMEPGATQKGEEAEHQVTVAPEVGTRLDCAPICAAYEYAEGQVGYMRFKDDGVLLGVAVQPLVTGDKVCGALILAEVVSDKLLGEYSQGMLDGVVAVVVDHKVVAAFDKRTARRPAPLLLTSLEDKLEGWIPAGTNQKISIKEGEPTAAPEKIELVGHQWSALSTELRDAGKSPVGWVVFLADTVRVDDVVRTNVVYFALMLVLFVPFLYFLIWKLYPVRKTW